MLRSIMQDAQYAVRQWRYTVIGGALAWFFARFAGSYIYGVRPHAALTFAAEAFVLAASSFLVAWLPARRAAAVDPILALRSE